MLLSHIVYANVTSMDRYLPGIIAVIAGSQTLLQAVTQSTRCANRISASLRQALAAVLLFQLTLQDLAGGGQRQRVEEADRLGDFVLRQVGPTVGEQVFAGGLAGFEDHEDASPLPHLSSATPITAVMPTAVWV